MQQVAFIGCGRIADHIAKFFEEGVRGAKVVQVCDIAKEKADKMAQRLNAEAVYDMSEVFNNPDVDLVLVLTESGKHGIHAGKALEAKKNVIVEKPIALLPQEAEENAHLAEKRDLMYAPIKQNRFNPAIQHLKQTLDAGRFGKPVLSSVRVVWCRHQDYYEDGWHGTWGMDGGVINQQAIHHIDALQWIAGPVKEVVSAQGNMLNRLEAEDTTVALVRFEDGSLGTIEATTAARPDDKEASLSVVGEKGTAEIGDVALNKIVEWHFTDNVPEDKEVKEKYSQEVPGGYGLSHGPLLQEIINRLNNNVLEPPITAEDALKSVRIVHALYKSAEEGRWVALDEGVVSERLGKTNN